MLRQGTKSWPARPVVWKPQFWGSVGSFRFSPEESNSYRIIYSGILEGAVNGPKCLILLVGAGRFERPTPCAQDMLIPSFGHQ